MLGKSVLAMTITILVGTAADPAQAADLDRIAPVYRVAPAPSYARVPPPSLGYGLCYVQQLVPTPWGPRWQLVNRC